MIEWETVGGGDRVGVAKGGIKGKAGGGGGTPQAKVAGEVTLPLIPSPISNSNDKLVEDALGLLPSIFPANVAAHSTTKSLISDPTTSRQPLTLPATFSS